MPLPSWEPACTQIVGGMTADLATAEENLLDLRATRQFSTRSRCRDLTSLQHIGAVAEGERLADILFNN